MKRNFIILPLLIALSFSIYGDETKSSPKTIHDILTDNYSEFKKCYDNTLKKTKENFDFYPTVKFAIDDQGKTSNINIKTKSGKLTAQEKEISDCMKMAINKISFPKATSKGRIEVSQPFRFRFNR